MKRAAAITLFGGGSVLLAASAAARSTTSNRKKNGRSAVGSVADLPFDENGRLASHVLLYSDGKCADIIGSGEAPYGFELRAVTGDAEAALFPGEGGGALKSEPESVEDCRAVCVERGVDRSLVAAPMPSRRYEGFLPFATWFRESCRKVELCFLNHRRDRPPLVLSMVDDKTGERKRKGVIKYEEGDKMACLGNYLGRRFEVSDPETGEVLLEHTADFTSTVNIGEPPPLERGSRNFTAEIESALRKEWGRHGRIKRTFSSLGFRKGRLPDDLFASMGAFYYNNRNGRVREDFSGGKGPYLNWWEREVQFVQVPMGLRASWQTRLRELVEAWAGVDLEETYFYGMRRYEEGARLLTHVDRHNTHAASLIVNVAQGDLSEPWPVEVYDHAERLHQITMEPGDIVYYESAKCLHARSVPLRGDGAYYVNLFAHYRPVGDDEWFERANPEGTPEPLIDVGGCRLSEGMTTDQVGRGAVRCDDDSVGVYLSPTLFRATSGEDLIRWWRFAGSEADLAELAGSRDEL